MLNREMDSMAASVESCVASSKNRRELKTPENVAVRGAIPKIERPALVCRALGH
jgi:hypothetical protein